MKILSTVKKFFQQADMILFVLCCAASGFGLVLIASATNYMDSDKPLMVQIAAFALGIALYAVFSFIDIELIAEKWKWILAFNILFIASLQIFGIDAGTGNKAWIRFDFIGIGIQPAEVVKMTFIIILARQMVLLQEKNISSIKSVGKMLGHLALMCGLIMAVSGDAGMTLMYVLVFAVMAFTAGVKIRWFAGALALSAAGLALGWGHLKGYWRDRILVVLDHSLATLTVGWQQKQSVRAIGAGHISGMGLFKGVQTQNPIPGTLPARHTDFIFAVAGEELGMIGCLLILFILAAIIVRCIYVGLIARSTLSGLVCMGIAGMLLFQCILNIGMCLFFMPVIGLTLPFFSYGGSSLITMFIAMGIVSSVKMRTLPSWIKDRREGGAPDANTGHR